jgi:hypothetical protein
VVALISHVSYVLFHPDTFSVHVNVLSNMAAWAILSLGCQWLLRRDYRPDAVRLLWLGIDALLLTVELWLLEAVYSPLLIIYGLFIVASVLWFRTALVWFATGMAAAGYALMLLEARLRQGLGGLGVKPHYHVIFFAGLVALGFMVAYQVQRVRVLSRYYEHRPL